MTADDPFLLQLRDLISVHQSEVERLEKRLSSTQTALDSAQYELVALRETERLYRKSRGLPPVEFEQDSELAKRLGHLPVRQMIVELARISDNKLSVAEAAKALVQAGLFKDVRNATGNIYAALNRAPHQFRKVGRGEYILLSPRDADTAERAEEEALPDDLPDEVIESLERQQRAAAGQPPNPSAEAHPTHAVDKTSFTEWLRRHHRNDDALGSFARDVLSRPGWPTSGTSFSDFNAHMKRAGFSQHNMRLLDAVWSQYVQQVKPPVAGPPSDLTKRSIPTFPRPFAVPRPSQAPDMSA